MRGVGASRLLLWTVVMDMEHGPIRHGMITAFQHTARLFKTNSLVPFCYAMFDDSLLGAAGTG